MDNKLLKRMQDLCDIAHICEEEENDKEYDYERRINQVTMSYDGIENNISKILTDVEITNDNGEVTVIIQRDDLFNNEYTPNEIIDELNNNKDKYKDLIDISDVIDGNYQINDYEASVENGNIILNIDFSIK